jgi:hypothetical protein
MLFWRGQIYHNIIKFFNYIYIHLNHLKLTISSSSSFWMLFFFNNNSVYFFINEVIFYIWSYLLTFKFSCRCIWLFL